MDKKRTSSESDIKLIKRQLNNGFNYIINYLI